jgi:hypothetical protein
VSSRLARAIAAENVDFNLCSALFIEAGVGWRSICAPTDWALSIPHTDCRRIDARLFQIAQYLHCKDRPEQTLSSGQAPHQG